jgi:hypothetical protein
MTDATRAAERRRRCVIALAFVAVIGWAHATNPAEAQTSKERAAIANMIDHTIECTAYFTIVAHCIRNKDPSDELVVRYDHFAQQAERLGIVLADKVGLKPEAFVEKAKYIMQGQMNQMSNDCINVSVLFQYADRCKRLIEAPDAVLREFLGKPQPIDGRRQDGRP